MKLSPKTTLILGGLILLSGCTSPATPTAAPPIPTITPTAAPTTTPTPNVQPISLMPEGTDGFAWWNDTVFYEIFVRSFADSDGDGVGDFNGLTASLDYLNDGDPATTSDLGITGIWLMPINPSPSYHGYDVTDYYDVNPDYGSMEDFQRFLEEAHERGIRVIMDLVLNHTSSHHPWFAKAQNPNSEHHNWYVWAENPLGPGWHSVANGSRYYYGLFWSGMPDLNYENPDVTAQMYAVAAFWLTEVGVDGFRLDAAKHLIEDGLEISNTPATHEWFEDFRVMYKALNPEAITVGEVWDATILMAEYVQGDEFDLAFNFDLAAGYLNAAQSGRSLPAISPIRMGLPYFLPNQFAPFLTNHDQNRVMSILGGDLDQAKLAAALLLTGPGTPFIYYGEEIGMLGMKPDEDIRTPMQWSAETGGGFTTGEAWHDLNQDYTQKNVANQTDDSSSLLWWYRTLIQLRNQHAALRVGETLLVDSGNHGVYAILRASEGETILVVINLTGQPVSDYALSLNASPLVDGDYPAYSLLDDSLLAAITMSGGAFEEYRPLETLDAYQVLVIQISK